MDDGVRESPRGKIVEEERANPKALALRQAAKDYLQANPDLRAAIPAHPRAPSAEEWPPRGALDQKTCQERPVGQMRCLSPLLSPEEA